MSIGAADAVATTNVVVVPVAVTVAFHPAARFSARLPFVYVAARPVPGGSAAGAIPGSQNADWPPTTGDCADAAHCVPDTLENVSTLIAAGGAVRPDRGDGKSTTTGTSVRPYGIAWNVTVSRPMGNRFSSSTLPHCTMVALARKQSNSIGNVRPVPGSRVHRSVHVCWLISRSSTSRAPMRVGKSGAWIWIGSEMVRFDAAYPNGRSPSSSSDPMIDVTGCGAPRS